MVMNTFREVVLSSMKEGINADRGYTSEFDITSTDHLKFLVKLLEELDQEVKTIKNKMNSNV